MSWNKVKQEKVKDSFWLGFIPSLVLPLIILIIILKTSTKKPIIEFIVKFAQERPEFLRKDLLASIIPCFVLLFIFNKLKKDKATAGAFVGAVPFIIFSFWMF